MNAPQRSNPAPGYPAESTGGAMIMAAIDASRKPRIAIPESALEGGHPPGVVLREFADDYSRARYAAMMADADYRYPDRIRELYLQSLSVPRIPTTFREKDADARRMRHLAVAFTLTGMFAILGLIASVALAA